MRSPVAAATPAAGSADSHRSRIVAKAREMSNTPSFLIATTDGPMSGRHTRPTRVPAVESVGRVECGIDLYGIENLS